MQGGPASVAAGTGLGLSPVTEPLTTCVHTHACARTHVPPTTPHSPLSQGSNWRLASLSTSVAIACDLTQKIGTSCYGPSTKSAFIRGRALGTPGCAPSRLRDPALDRMRSVKGEAGATGRPRRSPPRRLNRSLIGGEAAGTRASHLSMVSSPRENESLTHLQLADLTGQNFPCRILW